MAHSIINLVSQKIARKDRLTREDALALFASDDLVRLGKLANAEKEKRWDRRALFVLNRQINPSNICILSCRFCDFATKRGRPNAYEMALEEILAKCEGAREVHIVSALHPEQGLEYYETMLRAITQRYPDVQIKAFTAVEIDYFAKKARLSVEQVFERLKAVGLVAMPGGGAEVFSERVRKQLFPFKMGASRWLAIHRIAHRMGIPTNATLLYGHIETHEERVDHMLRLRELQDQTRGFLSFIPLAYQVGKTNVVARQASAIEDLKTIAIARLVLDNFPHIKAYWVTMGEETASIALQFGADDMDGTIGQEKIMHAADAATPALLTRQRLLSLIRESGNTPVERDALYREVRVYDDPASDPTEALALEGAVS